MSRNKAMVGIVCVMVGIAALFALAGEPVGLPAGEPAKTENSPRVEKAKQVAAAWFDALMRGDAAATLKLSEVPFAWDRKQVVESTGELEKLLVSVVEKKGKRDLKPTAIKVMTDKKEIQENAFPADYIIVHLFIGDEGIAVCVKPGDTYQVVGFSD